MFDAVTAAAIEVTLAAVLTCRRADRTSCSKQVNAFGGIAKVTFSIGSKISVAGETIHIFGVG
jgi:hypothetical protein